MNPGVKGFPLGRDDGASVPRFHYNKGGTNQSDGGNGVDTKVTMPIKVVDSHGVWNPLNSRFTPGPGEIWLLTASSRLTSGSDGQAYETKVFKNGAAHLSGVQHQVGGTIAHSGYISCLVEGNGTDYFEIYSLRNNSAAGGTIDGTVANTWVQGIRLG